jgi:hypothetical protein
MKLPDKASVATEHADRTHFFQDILSIQKPSRDMHITALKTLTALGNPNKEDTFREMINISAFGLIPASAKKDLTACKCFPVRLPSGEIQWMSCNSEFGVVDRSEYGRIFKDHASLLDFSIEEVHDASIFLIGMGLEGRYMSKLVQETTEVRDGLFNDHLTRGFRRKAYALCR